MRYFFHFRDGDRFIRDSEGDELSDLAAAREEGRCSARDLMNLDRGQRDPGFRGAVFEITTELGEILAVTSFDEATLSGTPVV